MKYKIVSIHKSPLEALLDSLKSVIREYETSQDYNKEVLDFLISVRENIKWAIEMKSENSVPKPEIAALIDFAAGRNTVNQQQFDTLFKWLDRPTDLDFWVKKYHKDNGMTYQFDDQLPSKKTYPRITTFLSRIHTMAQEDRLNISPDSLIGFADIWCKYGKPLSTDSDPISNVFFKWINHDYPQFAPDVMSKLLELGSKNAPKLLDFWLSRDEFVTHKHYHELIERYLLGAVDQPHLDPITKEIAKDLLGDDRFKLLGVVFNSNKYLSNQIRFADNLIANMDVESSLHVHHLYKLSQSSENARQVFANGINKDQEASSLKRMLLANVGVGVNQNDPILEYPIHVFFHPMIDQLQLFKQISSSQTMTDFFLNLIKTSEIKTMRRPKEAIQLMQDIHSLLWKFNSKVGGGMFESVMTGMCSFSGLDSDTPIKTNALDIILNTLIEIKPSDIRTGEKKDAILSYLNEQFGRIQNIASLNEVAKEIKSKFIHFLLQNRYTDKDAEPWFRQLNPDLHSDIYSGEESKGDAVGDILSNTDSYRNEIMQTIRRHFENLPVTASDQPHPTAKKISHIHNTQMQALCSVKQLINTHNLMLRLKTGQGKSLIAEMSAIQVLKDHGNNVKTALIVTSYEHLAKRDQESMKFLVDAYGYQSILLENKGDLKKLVRNQDQKSIVHVESENLRRIIHDFLSDLLINLDQINPENKSIFDKLFDVENLCVVLDEVDLMTWDRSRYCSIENAAPLFEPSRDISYEGRKTILTESCPEGFKSKFTEWLTKEHGKLSDSKSTDSNNPASGIVTRLVASFASNLAKGVYNFNMFNWDFVSYIRKFKYTVSLSGSITRQSVNFFEEKDGKPGLFENGKPNLFIEFPSFFGPHVDHINLKMQKDPQTGLSRDRWISALVEDIRGAIHRNQPVLVFLDDNSKDNPKFDLAVREIESILNLPSDFKFKYVTSKHEKEIENLVPQIGKVKTITFATRIIGRGVDIEVSSAVEEGLHLSIGMIPLDDDKPNFRLLTQMIGRTARQDKRGSYSIITQDAFNWADFQNSKTNPPEESLGDGLDAKNKKFDLSVDFYRRFLSGNHRILDRDSLGSLDKRKQWVLMAHLMRDSETIKSDDEIAKVRTHFGLWHLNHA